MNEEIKEVVPVYIHKLDELLWAIESLETELILLDKDNPDVNSLINTLEIVMEKAKNYKGEK